MKKKWFLLLGTCLFVMWASFASAAVTLERLGEHPFSSPAMTSEADLRSMVGKHNADLKTGFAKAGNPELFTEFMDQFPTTTVESIQIAPGEQLSWMLFRSKSTGQVKVIKDVTWGGKTAFDAYRFYITKDGRRYEFIVPAECGNLSLRNVVAVPVKPAMTPPPVAVVPEPVSPEPEEIAERRGGPVVDAGVAYQFDPASYVFARVGYEIMLADKLSAMGLVGGFIRFDGEDGGDAFTADALLNYYFTDKMFVGGGVGYWSGNDGKIDLIVNLGYLVYENPGVMRTSLFIEGRCEADDLISSNASRLGAGVRFQF